MISLHFVSITKGGNMLSAVFVVLGLVIIAGALVGAAAFVGRYILDWHEV